MKLVSLSQYSFVWLVLSFGSLWIFCCTFWNKSCRVEKRNPQCAINSDDNDLLTKQSSGLHTPPHCFLRMLMVESWANISLWDIHTGLKKCVIVYVCPCISNALQATAQDCTMTPASVLTFTTCLPAVNLFAQSFQGAEPLWGIFLDHSSDFVWLQSVC